jgi:hypothetical protein
LAASRSFNMAFQPVLMPVRVSVRLPPGLAAILTMKQNMASVATELFPSVLAGFQAPWRAVSKSSPSSTASPKRTVNISNRIDGTVRRAATPSRAYTTGAVAPAARTALPSCLVDVSASSLRAAHFSPEAVRSAPTAVGLFGSSESGLRNEETSVHGY